MKRRTRQTSKKIIMVALSALTIVNVFCLGFASFISKGAYTAMSGNVNVNIGGQVSATMKAKPINAPEITQHGFVKDGGTASIASSLDLLLDFNIKIPSGGAKPSLKFSITQVDNPNEPAYADFDMLKYLDSVTVNSTTNTIVQTAVTKKPTTVNGVKSKYVVFSLSDKCFAPYDKFVADTTISFNFAYPKEPVTDSDFASDIFAPIKYGAPTFDLEITNA